MKSPADLRHSFLLVVALLIAPVMFGQGKRDSMKYRDAKVPIEKRIDDLLPRMTPEEKVAQLQCITRDVEKYNLITGAGLGEVGPFMRSLSETGAAAKANRIQSLIREKTRLGIPAIFHDEALHGLIGNGATSFPQAIALASSWDTALVETVAKAIGKETRARGIQHVLSPVINIARDVRWGRVEETYGEDPFLTSRIGVAFCRGLYAEGVITTPKHYAANFGDGGRDSYPANISERLLREIYFPAFEACIREGHAGSVMAAYNSLDGIPCSANHWLLTDVLRKEWGFQGFVVSDYGSVSGIQNKHFVAATKKDAAIKALEAGLDMELPDISCFGEPLLEAVRDGSVPAGTLNEAVRRVLRAKFRLGLFEDPMVHQGSMEVDRSPEHRALARQSAREGIVLLKNEKNLLPLDKNLKAIAVIGPNADAVQLGGYSGWGQDVMTILQGIRNKVSKATSVFYQKGCEIGFTSLPPIPSVNLLPPGGAPGEHGLRGEYFTNKNLEGTPVFVRVDSVVSFDWAMGSPDSARIPPDHFSVRWTGKLVPSVSGTYRLGASTDDGLRLYLDGKLVINSWFDRGATLDYITVPLQAHHEYDIRMEYYENEGYAYAGLVWYRLEETDPRIQAAVDAAGKADVAVIVTGIIEGEGYDRANLDLPGVQEELIHRVAATGTPTVVVLVNGSAVTMRNWADQAGAILEPWYSGEEGGNAVADVLFGDYNPGGRLPVTFPQFVGQVPLYYDHKPTGRGDDYSDMSGSPAYPFGFGLSYTTFEYSNLRLDPSTIRTNGSVRVSVDVRNTGQRRGDEVVQLYIHDVVASVARPVKELKAFTRISLEPREVKTVSFNLGRVQLSFLDQKLRPTVEPGKVEIMIGSSSEDIRAKADLEVTK